MAPAHMQRVEAIPVCGLLDDLGTEVSRDSLQVCIEPCGCLLEAGEREATARDEKRPQGAVSDGADRRDARLRCQNSG